MVDVKKLSEEFAAAPQLTQQDFETLASAGYKTIINNRPDGEEAGQLSAADAQEIAQKEGLNYLHVPVTMSDLNAEKIQQFEQALKDSPKPILAHCRSGMRSSILWAIAKIKNGQMSIEEVISTAAQQGYDLSRVRPLLEQYSGIS